MTDAPSPAPPAIDAGFELFDEGQPTTPRGEEEPQYWYARTDSAVTTGPLSALEIRKQLSSGAINPDFLVWRSGLPQWTRLGDHFGIPHALGASSIKSFPPIRSLDADASKVAEALETFGNWQPTPFVLRCVARFTLVIGMAIIVLSLLLMFFGNSWFSGGLQMILIGIALEITALGRSAMASAGTLRAPANDMANRERAQ